MRAGSTANKEAASKSAASSGRRAKAAGVNRVVSTAEASSTTAESAGPSRTPPERPALNFEPRFSTQSASRPAPFSA